MNTLEIKWVLESCILSLDETITKEQMIKWDIPEELAEMGIKLGEFLKEKGAKYNTYHTNHTKTG